MDVKNISQGRQQISSAYINERHNYSVNKLDNLAKDKDKDKEISDKELLEKINKFFQEQDFKFEYSTHEKFKNCVILKVTNKKTHEVILEVPPKKILDMVAKMCEKVGFFLDKKA